MRSLWWPTPARPTTWFGIEALASSDTYHGPLRRVVAVRTCALGGGLGGACFVSRSVDEQSSWEARLALATLLVTAALWVPSALSDWWFDQRHEPRFGAEPLPARQLAVGSAVTAAVVFVALGAVASLLSIAAALANGWVLLALLLSAVVGYGVVKLRHQADMASLHLSELDVDEAKPFVGLALRNDIPGVSFWQTPATVEPGCNALTLASGGSAHRVVLSQELLAAEPATSRFVVAHELGHLRYEHLGKQRILSMIESGAAIGLPVVVAAYRPAWMAMSDAGLSDPRNFPFLVVAVLLLMRLIDVPMAWVSRAHERQADAFAIAEHRTLNHTSVVEILSELYRSERANLRPSLVERVLSRHPTPAERLQIAAGGG